MTTRVLLDLVTDYKDGKPCEWLVVKRHEHKPAGGSVSINREWICYDGARRPDPEVGITFGEQHIPAILAALALAEETSPDSAPDLPW